MQHAAWAMQRALVEAGYRWVIDGKTDDEEPKKPLDIPNAWVVRTLVLWEIDLGHWEKAITLMDALSTAYDEDTPENRLRRSDLLRLMAIPTEKTMGVQAAMPILQSSISFAGLEVPRNPREPIVLPEHMKGNALLLRPLVEYIVLQIRSGILSPKKALPTLLSIARVYRETPLPLRDICGEGAVQLNIGEIMYALGRKDESLEWTKRAVNGTRSAVDQQPSEEDRQRCVECIGNGCNSLGILYEVWTYWIWLTAGTWTI
jgi:hypothetical protein